MYKKSYKCVNVIMRFDASYILSVYLFVVLINCSAVHADTFGNYHLPTTVLYFSLRFSLIIKRTWLTFFRFHVTMKKKTNQFWVNLLFDFF